MQPHNEFRFHPQVVQIGCYWGQGSRPGGLPLIYFPADYERTIDHLLGMDIAPSGSATTTGRRQSPETRYTSGRASRRS